MSLVHWKDMVRAHLLGKVGELRHTFTRPIPRASRLEHEREVVQGILRLYPNSRADQLDVWHGAFPQAGDRRYDRRKAEVVAGM